MIGAGFASVAGGARRRSAVAGTPILSPGSFAGAFTRASAGTYRGLDDTTIIMVGNDAPRFQGAPRRLLIEPTISNLIPATPGTGLWYPLNMGVTTNARAAPDGTTSAVLLTADGVSGRHLTEAFCYIAAGNRNTFSGYFERAGYDLQIIIAGPSGRGWAYFNLATGAVSETGTSGTNWTDPFAYVSPAGGSRFRCELSVYANEGEAYPSFVVSDRLTHTGSLANDSPVFAGNGGGFYAWGAQYEQAFRATSVITGEAPPTTRAGDVTLYTIPQEQASTGTIIGQFIVGDTTPVNRNLIALNIDVSNEIYAYMTGSTVVLGRGAADIYVEASGAPFTAGTPHRFGLAWGNGTASFCLNGGAAQTVSGATVGNYTQLFLGTNIGNGGQLNGEMANVTLSAARLTDTQLAAATL